ncbi:MAG: hypothetical protein KKI08_17890, partial [Armatimonadetes bacterium]|nr:hypothetical protein [Armatimonadota bacterium]
LIYDSQKLIAEAGASALSRYYLSEGGSIYSPLVSQLGSQHWFLFDALGSTMGLTNDAGSLSDTFRYEAFGTSLGRTGATGTPYQYGGGRGYFNEPDLGLQQVLHAWRVPEAGAWADPYGSRTPSGVYPMGTGGGRALPLGFAGALAPTSVIPECDRVFRDTMNTCLNNMIPPIVKFRCECQELADKYHEFFNKMANELPPYEGEWRDWLQYQIDQIVAFLMQMAVSAAEWPICTAGPFIVTEGAIGGCALSAAFAWNACYLRRTFS